MERAKCGRCFKEIEWYHPNHGWIIKDKSYFWDDTKLCFGVTGDPPMLHDPAAPNLATDPMGRKWAT